MAILIDFNQIVIGNYFALSGSIKSKNFIPQAPTNGEDPVKVNLDEDLVRHIVLNTIRDLRKRFHKEFGELIICCDGRNYWRKKVFPFYKAGRAKGREVMADTQGINWEVLFSALNMIRDELKTVFPYKVLCVDGAESDDLIATIVKTIHKPRDEDFFNQQPEKILIVSSDHDFRQLQIFPGVRQWSPAQKKFVEEIAPARYLKEHILRGDGGDGVPNVLSADNSFVDKIRQKKLSQKRLLELLENIPPELEKNYKRNFAMCNLIEGIPADVAERIVTAYSEPVKGSRKNLMMYFASKRMKNLLKVMGDF